MKLSYKWLTELSEIDTDINLYIENMTRAGIAVEGAVTCHTGIKGIVSGKIVELKAHPQADNLQICIIDINKTNTVSIITAAKNVRVGAVVPVALAGAILSDSSKIEPVIMRGVSSEGMLCSWQELGLNNKVVAEHNKEGIYLLPNDTPLGQELADILIMDDSLVEFDLTANRADCFSVLGIARESSIVVEHRMLDVREKLKITRKETITDKTDLLVSVAEQEDCKLFAALVIDGVDIKESPLWLQNKIQSFGMRPINNIVDITNYIMWVSGQPLHAYDYNKLKTKRISVRRACLGETITTLDGEERNLDDSILVISTDDKLIGIAGIMGGDDCEVENHTKKIVLEAAHFDSALIRRAGKKLGLRTDAAARFERGVDANSTLENLMLAADYIVDICDATAISDVILSNNLNQNIRQIATTFEQVNKLLGTSIAAKEIIDFLQLIGCSCQLQANNLLIVEPPSWRNDIVCWQDLAEEVARLYGYDNIPATLPQLSLVNSLATDSKLNFVSKITNNLAAKGLYETISYSFTNQALIDKLNLDEKITIDPAIKLINPIVDEFSHMRNNILANLLHTIKWNQNHKNSDLALFEIGKVFRTKSLPLQDLPKENIELAIALTADIETRSWLHKARRVDYYDLKGIVEMLLAELGFLSVTLSRAKKQDYWHPGMAADVWLGDDYVGSMGKIHPLVQENFDLSCDVFAAVLDVDLLWRKYSNKKQYKPISKSLAYSRDLSFTVNRDIMAAGIVDCIKDCVGAALEQIEIFDVYIGDNIASDKKSVAINLRLVGDSDVDKIIESVITTLQRKLDAEIRQ